MKKRKRQEINKGGNEGERINGAMKKAMIKRRREASRQERREMQKRIEGGNK